MSKRATPIYYEPEAGMHIAMAATVAISIAREHNRRVCFDFNGVKMTVNKRLSSRHVQHIFEHITKSRSIRYSDSPAGLAAKRRRAAAIAESQKAIYMLLADLPSTKLDAAAFLAKWVPLADDVDVDSHHALVSDLLRSLGFVKSQHVGDPDLLNGTAAPLKRIEYIAGQVLSLLDTWGTVHPMIGNWAAKLADEIKVKVPSTGQTS